MDDIPLPFALHETIAMSKGDAYVAGCRQCGCVLYVAGGTVKPPKIRALGPCPKCAQTGWYKVDYAVASFPEVTRG